MKIVHLGGETTVTGSCHLLKANGLNVLVDCGLAQGRDRLVPMEDWPVDPGKVLIPAFALGRTQELLYEVVSGTGWVCGDGGA